MLTDAQQRNAAKKFAAEWEGRGYEKGETHAFWMELLQTVCGVINPAQFITFEYQVQLGHTSFVDAYIPETKVMIEVAIEKAGQKILDARCKYPDATLADLYGDKMFAFTELQQAHVENDNLVKQAYGYSKNISEYEIVADLMKRYQELTAKEK